MELEDLEEIKESIEGAFKKIDSHRHADKGNPERYSNHNMNLINDLLPILRGYSKIIDYLTSELARA